MRRDPSIAAVPPGWVTLLGVVFFVALTSAGCADDATFVQVGVTDLGRRLLGLSDARVAGAMALLALLTAGVASGDRTGEPLARLFGWAMVGGTLALGALARIESPWLRHLGRPHARGAAAPVPGARRAFRGLLLLAAAALLAGCDAAQLGITWVRGDQHLVVDGARQAGVLIVTGGEMRLAPGSRTDGPVLLLGGTLTIDGLVTGDVLAPSGRLVLGPWAAVHGTVGVGGGFERHPDALVIGEVTTGLGLPGGPAAAWGGGWWRVLLQALATAAWAAAWARWAPRRLRTMGAAVGRHAPVAAALGVLVVVGLVTAVIMAFTLVRIPAALLLVAVGVVAVGTGWAALGYAIADALGRGPLRELQGRTVLLAALGGFDVALVLGLVERLPWVGGAIALVVTVTAVGAVALTGFGGRAFVRAGEAVAAAEAA